MGFFYCLRAQTKLSSCCFQNVSSHISTQDEEVEHPALITLVTIRSLLGKKHPKKEENSNFSSHVIFQTLFLHGVHRAGKEKEAITGMEKQKYI